MLKTIVVPTLALIAATVVASTASGDGHADKAMKAAIDARKAQMKLIAYNMSILGGMAKGETPFDSAVATSAATNLSAVAKLDRSTLWVDGSIQGQAPDTRAKAEIWSDPAGFEKSAVALETAADALIEAAGKDVAAIQAGMGAAGQSCKSCHESYRGPKN